MKWRYSSLAMAFVSLLASGAQGDDLDRVSWLAGGWRAEMDGVVIEEHWIPDAGGMMLGVSRTVSDGRAVAFEFLRLEARGNRIFYIAQPNGGAATEFELEEGSVVDLRFENPEHDHPQVISYRLSDDDTLRVRIEGDEGEQAWEFQRIASP